MTLKSIDTQISLSRTMETGVLQSHLNHKPIDDQTATAAQSQKLLEEQRMKSNQVEQTADSKIRDGGGQGSRYRGNKSKQKEHKSEEEAGNNDHPYKGRFIDLSL